MTQHTREATGFAKGTLLTCPACGRELQLAISAKQVVCSQNRRGAAHAPRLMIRTTNTEGTP